MTAHIYNLLAWSLKFLIFILTTSLVIDGNFATEFKHYEVARLFHLVRHGAVVIGAGEWVGPNTTNGYTYTKLSVESGSSKKGKMKLLFTDSGWLAWQRFRCNIDCKDDPENCIR